MFRGVWAILTFVAVVIGAVILGVGLLNLIDRMAGGTIIGSAARKVEDLTQPDTGLFAG